MRYFLHLAFDGTDFHGWQRQPNASSVQQTIEEALETVFRRPVEIVGAGRTDAGVHAREMYAHVDIDNLPDKKRLLTSLNRMVGNSIAIHDILRVKDDAHARFNAVSREYKYYISTVKDPFDFRFANRIERIPDVSAMNNACRIILNTTDFTSFSKLHTDVKTNNCKVFTAHWEYKKETGKLIFTIKADRFLRNMVRAIVGTLLEVGFGKISDDDLKAIIDKKNRCAAGVSMPAKGLFLNRIEYPTDIFI